MKTNDIIATSVAGQIKALLVLYFSLIIASDINECANVTVCDQGCVNTSGSYFCICNEGYVLSADNSTCEGK